ncbi:SrfA family protein [Yersinia pekkanenii]|uniref:Virulence factor n=1 Tax=Yersinia pekkanenii TaxID=1288385 RepID=A0A0T9PAF3_9GAMM|nr:SrfA family protein [Yersinia pekkanenii]CNH54265.1 putative virulence factor [Yersinia pekkanenii]CRY67530.1 putative virulence factor [Yersinia pekkanenii]
MAKSFLRSGSLDDILALGENGQPVYASALQIREALRLKKQPHIADCLAIPQLNERGDRIDWYAPIEGNVTPWLAASNAERKAAIKQLSACLASVNDLCQRAQKSEKAAQRLFGVLLAKTMQFPDQSYVYWVAGKPVLTFWGFVSQDKKTRTDPLDCLHQTAAVIEPVISAPPAIVTPPVTAAVELPPSSDIAPAIPPIPVVEPITSTEPIKKPARWRRVSWILPVLALITALVVQFSGGMSENSAAAPEIKSFIIKDKIIAAENKARPAQDAATVVTTQILQSTIEPQLPLDNATITPAPAVTEPAVIPIATTAESKNVLRLPFDAVKIGSTAFLNGNWRVSPDIKAAYTGKAPSLKYQIKNGQGTVKITHGDNVTCRANITAGLMKSGNLVINSRYRAQCSDGSKYQMPEIVCKQGASGMADCKGRYDPNTTLPMTMKRETK